MAWNEDLGVVEALCEFDSPHAPVKSPFGIPRVHAERRHVAVGHGEFASEREPLEQRHSFPPGLLSLRDPAGAPEDGRQRAKRISFPAPVAKLSVALDRT